MTTVALRLMAYFMIGLSVILAISTIMFAPAGEQAYQTNMTAYINDQPDPDSIVYLNRAHLLGLSVLGVVVSVFLIRETNRMEEKFDLK